MLIYIYIERERDTDMYNYNYAVRESIEVRESRKVVLGDIQQK